MIGTERLFAPWLAAKGVLLAVSGGCDSVALMHLAAAWRTENCPPLFVACVDHGVRPGAAAEADAVCREATALQLPATVLRWVGVKPTRALQERAREARYRLLIAHAATLGVTHLVTAHTLDDQAETLLFRMSRGSGPAGLAGMAPARVRDGLVHVRPFLGLRKIVLRELCHARGWTYAEDPSNLDDRFARARLRKLAPLLEREGLSADRLGTLAGRAARAETALQAFVALAERDTGLAPRVFDFGQLGGYPMEIVLRVVRNALLDNLMPRPIRLDRLERLTTDLLEHHAQRLPLRRTLAGHLVRLDDEGHLSVVAEPPRRAQATSSRLDVEGPVPSAASVPPAVPLARTPTHHTLLE